MPSMRISEPTIDLSQDFAVESILAIARRRGFHIHLDDNRERIIFDDLIPVWLATAITIYESELVELMRAEFLGVWQCVDCMGVRAA
jgi:hypothetical protein